MFHCLVIKVLCLATAHLVYHISFLLSRTFLSFFQKFFSWPSPYRRLNYSNMYLLICQYLFFKFFHFFQMFPLLKKKARFTSEASFSITPSFPFVKSFFIFLQKNVTICNSAPYWLFCDLFQDLTQQNMDAAPNSYTNIRLYS